jgi:hypothetical protein
MYTKLSTVGIATFSLLILFTRDAHAYLDLGTGSFMLQMALGAALGAVVTVKLYWRKIKETLKNIGSIKKRNTPVDGE